ncbi:Uncharacterised protein [Candidatus Gugararchaeum adminiculabundum]|nr:Uncharacterised protein [Candidatus Gugararchaeum adminiculabundum]
MKIDEIISKVEAHNEKVLKKGRKVEEGKLYSKIGEVVNAAQALHDSEQLERKDLKRLGLLSLDEAHGELTKRGVPISFRAFGGRVERKTIHSAKIGGKRVIPKVVIDDLATLHSKYYGVRGAYDELKKHVDITYRAFIGRIEKRSVPSVKIGTQRWIPKAVIEGLVQLQKGYYDVSEAVDVLHGKGISIKRNAFERRLDRGRISHKKFGGRRMIAKDVLNGLVSQELERRNRV